MERKKQGKSIKNPEKEVIMGHPPLETVDPQKDAEMAEMSDVAAEIKAIKHRQEIMDKKDKGKRES